MTLERVIDRRAVRAASTLVHLGTSVWTNSRLPNKKNLSVYNGCVLSLFLFGSESLTTLAAQEP